MYFKNCITSIYLKNFLPCISIPVFTNVCNLRIVFCSDMEQKRSNLASPLCTRGCGFYGNPAFDGMCSKCYKDALKRSQHNPSPPLLSPVPTSLASLETSSEGTNSALGVSLSLSPKSSQVSVKTARSTLSGTSASASSSNSFQSASEEVKKGASAEAGRTVSSKDCAACASSQTEVKTTSQAETSVLSHTTSSQSVETGATTVPTVAKASAKTSEQASGTSVDVHTAAAAAAASSSPASPAESEKKPKKNRCHVCKKKVGLTGFECRCGGLYCGLHRYSDKHDCTFDYKVLAQEEIRKANPVVVGEKVAKI